MIRTSEKPIAYKAGLLAAGLHGLLLVALLLSVNWQTNQTMHVAEVELWDSLPASTPVEKAPEIKPPSPEPTVPEAKPEPEPAPPPAPEKPEIVLEKKPEKKIEKPIEKVVEKVIEKPKEKPVEKKPDLKKLQEDMRNDALKKEPELSLQEQMRLEDLSDNGKQPQAKSAASAGEVNQYKAAIQRKIQANVNKTLCGTGNPSLTFDIALTPTGELQGDPVLVKPSGLTACDEAVERAILQSQPLPMPPDASLRAQFRNLNLQFTPNK